MERQLPGTLAGAPISWGVCEVPGWGLQLPPERVFADMVRLGLAATELGPQGWLPEDGAQARSVLDRYGLKLVGGFVPVVVQEDTHHRDDTRRAAAQLAQAGGELFVAATVQDAAWSRPVALDADGGAARRAARRARRAHGEGGCRARAPPPRRHDPGDQGRRRPRARAHACTLVLRDGHLLIGGVDPVQFADSTPTASVTCTSRTSTTTSPSATAAESSPLQAVQHGLFKPLGSGDARIDEVVAALRGAGYERWLVLEQDLAITVGAPVGGGPASEVATSIEFLSKLAPAEAIKR